MKQRSYVSRIAVEIVVVVGVLGLANLVSLRLFARSDLTEGKVFSVSESTKKVLRGLDDVVNVKVYFSKKLPPYLAGLSRAVRDVLDEYRAYAGGNIVLDIEDPASDPDTEQRVRSLGIPQVQLNVIEKDKAEVMNGYLGIAVLYGDRYQVIPVVENPSNLEYELTSAILKVASQETKTVAFLTGHGGPDPTREYEAVARALERQYEITTAATSGGNLIPEGVNTLVVARPKALKPWDAFAIDQFLMRGGRLLLLIDRIEIPEGTLTGFRTDTGIDSLLASYGILVKPDLIVDRACGAATFSTGIFSFRLNYVLWPMVTKDGFSKTVPITNQLERAVFPWASSVEITDEAAQRLRVDVLAKTSAQSFSEERQLNLDPQRSFQPSTPVAPRNVAVLLTGSFESFFRDREVPVPEGGTPPPDLVKVDASPETQIIVVGNSRFADTAFLGEYPENRTFFLNAVDWLTLGESLIGIRSRTVTTRPLKEIGEKSKATIRFASTLGIPVALILWGLGRRYSRRWRGRRSTPSEQIT